MNQRIKSLLAKAHLDVMEDLGMLDSSQIAEKFAELLIKECTDFLRDKLDDHFAAEQLAEHFGIEQ